MNRNRKFVLETPLEDLSQISNHISSFGRVDRLCRNHISMDTTLTVRENGEGGMNDPTDFDPVT